MAQPFSLTEDGVESQLGTNHIGHFLFTQSILGKILAAGEGKRVVNVSSNAYKFGRVRFEDWNFKVRAFIS
jgi:NAD(P)-dependent dehydrogenase (short-subunit alcohol dehydrogenase family)